MELRQQRDSEICTGQLVNLEENEEAAPRSRRSLWSEHKDKHSKKDHGDTHQRFAGKWHQDDTFRSRTEHQRNMFETMEGVCVAMFRLHFVYFVSRPPVWQSSRKREKPKRGFYI